MMNLEWAEAPYQTLKLYGGVTPDIDDPENLKACLTLPKIFGFIINLRDDISDGGLVISLIEMSLCSSIGLDIRMDISSKEKRFHFVYEEVGLVVEVQNET